MPERHFVTHTEFGALGVPGAVGVGGVEEPDAAVVGRPQRRRVERRVHGIAGQRMGHLEIQHIGQPHGIAAAPQPDTCPRGETQAFPEILRHVQPPSSRSWAMASSRAACGLCGRGGRIRPSAPSISIRSSQASNSGAGRRPSMERSARMSWKERLW